MAIDQINVTTVDTPNSLGYVVPEKWNDMLYLAAQRQMFWAKFEGAEGSLMPVIRKDDFSKEAMDVLHISTLKNLTGSGVTGASTLQGNEEQLSLAQVDLQVDWLRHAVGVDKRSKGRVKHDVALQMAQPMLSRWMADKMDKAIFAAFETADTVLYGGDATSTATLDASDIMSCNLLDKVSTYLKDNLAIPMTTSNGNSFYGIAIHPYDAHNLKNDTTWRQAQRDSALRGDQNPIFTGALGTYNGIVIYENKGVKNTTNKSKCIAFGGDAIFRGYAQMPKFATQETDYGFNTGVAIEAVYGEKLNDVVNTNYAVIETYAANPAV